MVPAIIVGLVFNVLDREWNSRPTTSPVEGIALAIIVLGMLIGLLIYIPAAVIDSFRSGRRVQFAPWFAQLPLPAKILLAVLAAAVSVVLGIARFHVFR